MAERREVVAVITADPRRLHSELGRAGGQITAWGAKTGKDLKVSLQRGFGTFADIIGIGSAAGLLQAGRNVFEFQKRLTRLQITSGRARADMMRLEESIFRVAKARGLDPDQVLGGAEKYVERTGDLKGFMDSLDTLGTVGAATGATMVDISSVTAAMGQSLGVQADGMGAAWDVISRGANMGSVEVKNFAGIMAELAPTFGLFASKGVEGVSELSALMQMTARGFASAEEGATGLRAVMDTVIRQTKELKKHGIDVYGKNGQLRSLRDIVFDIGNSKLMRKETALQKALGGRGEAFRGLLAILKPSGGVKANMEFFDKLANVGDALGTTQAQAQTWENSPAGKMATAQAKLAETFNDKFKNNLDSIAESMDSIAKAISIAADHAPLLIGALAAAKLGPGLTSLLGGVGAIEGLVDAGGGGGGGRGGRGGKRGARLPSGAGQAAFLSLGAGIEAGNFLNDVVEDATGRSLSGHIADAMDAIVPASTFSTAMDPIAAARDAEFGGLRGVTTEKLLNQRDAAEAARRRLRGADFIGDPTAIEAGKSAQAGVDLQRISSQVNEAVFGALIGGLDTQIASSSLADKDRIAASMARSKAVPADAARALQAAIGETGTGSFFESNPEALAAIQQRAGALAGANPLAGVGGDAGLVGVIMELTKEIRALKDQAAAASLLDTAGVYGNAAAAIDDAKSMRHRRK